MKRCSYAGEEREGGHYAGLGEQLSEPAGDQEGVTMFCTGSQVLWGISICIWREAHALLTTPWSGFLINPVLSCPHPTVGVQ